MATPSDAPRPTAPPTGLGPPVTLWTAGVCAALFAALATALGLHPGLVFGVESAAHTWSTGHRPAVAAGTARVLTSTATGAWPYLAVVVAGVIAGGSSRERLRATVAFLVVLLSGQLVRYGVMEAVARPRPDRADWATRASGFSFPSGHSATSALMAGLLCWAVLGRPRRAAARWVCAVAAGWALAVGLTRIYLGVHWVGDVLGGWLFAAFWLAVAGCLLPRYLGPRTPAGGTASLAGDPVAPERGDPPLSRESLLGRVLPLAVAVAAGAVVMGVIHLGHGGVRVTGPAPGAQVCPRRSAAPRTPVRPGGRSAPHCRRTP